MSKKNLTEEEWEMLFNQYHDVKIKARNFADQEKELNAKIKKAMLAEKLIQKNTENHRASLSIYDKVTLDQKSLLKDFPDAKENYPKVTHITQLNFD